jgi:hypothetical protein
MSFLHHAVALQAAIAKFQADVTRTITDLFNDVICQLAPCPGAGTRVTNAPRAAMPQVQRRISRTSDTTIDIVCPAGT